MKLTNVNVKDYRSIRDSNHFSVGDITCLVGKNESGKTSLLKAIYKLNPIVDEHGTYDVTDEFPRSDVEEYRQAIENEEREHAWVVKAQYELSDDEVEEIEDALGKGVLTSRTITLKKGYEGVLFVTVDTDDQVAVQALLAGASLPSEIGNKAEQSQNLKKLQQLLVEDADKRAEVAAEAKRQAESISDAAEKARATAEAYELGESHEAEALRERIQPYVGKSLGLTIWKTFLKQHWPKFLYFDEYYQMEGHLNIEALKQRQATKTLLDSDRPMLGLIELARLKLDQLLNPERTEVLVSKLEGASNHLSKQILKYWSQNRHLHVGFDVRPASPGDPPGMTSGTNLWGRVHDSIHEVSTLLGMRSRGFLWFFSFLAWFSQQKKAGGPMILLLDEPGLYLHAKAQADLLRYMEMELKPHHQVIYSTHSPFMVDAQHFERVRIVEDRSIDVEGEPEEERKVGTQIFSDVLEAGSDTLFPLQGALGYDIAQTLFVGPNCLIVEGVSDLLYLQTVSALLEMDGREGLDPRWTITPVGGSDKVPTFVALLGSQKSLTVATLIDLQSKDQQSIENLYKRRLLLKKNVHTFADFTNTPEADIEDMFDLSFYLILVNGEFSQHLTKRITVTDLQKTTERVLVRLSKFFEKKPLKSGKFNHYRPARYFTEKVGTLKSKLPATSLDRFEAAFKAINKCLPSV